MKRITTVVAVAVVIAMSGFTLAQETTGPQKETTKNSNAQVQWKDQFEKRMKTYQTVAKAILASAERSNATEMSSAVEEAAATLPTASFHRTNLMEMAKSLRQLKAANRKTEKSTFEESKAKLVSIADQLGFHPTLDTDMPKGFPAPTPVGEIEIKSYPAYRMAKTKLKGESNDGQGASSFFRLFNHIQTNDIAMTAPVEMTYENGESGLTQSTMAFLYQDQDIGKVDKDGKVVVIDVEPKKVISMGLRGRPDKERINEVARQLRSRSVTYAALFELANDVRVMGYNGPSVPEADQFYEVQLELKKKPAKVKT